MKKYIVLCSTHDTAGLVFKFYKNFGLNDCVDVINSKAITELGRDFAKKEKEYLFKQSILNEVESYSK